MKKLMFAVAAIAAGVAVADVISANIVGYATRDTDETDLREGDQCFAPQFVSVGENGVKLLDLKFDFSAIAKIGGEVKIQRLDKNGFTTDSWQYYKGQTRGAFKTEGWYNKDSQLITTENQPTFKAGEGLYFGGVAGMTVTFNPPTLTEAAAE